MDLMGHRLSNGSDPEGFKLKTILEKHLVPMNKDIKKNISLYLDCEGIMMKDPLTILMY